MKIETHTHITLNVSELKDIIIANLKSQGYSVKLEDIDFLIGGGTYEAPYLSACKIICQKDEKNGK